MALVAAGAGAVARAFLTEDGRAPTLLAPRLDATSNPCFAHRGCRGPTPRAIASPLVETQRAASPYARRSTLRLYRNRSDFNLSPRDDYNSAFMSKTTTQTAPLYPVPLT